MQALLYTIGLFSFEYPSKMVKFGGPAAQLEGDASSFQVKARLTIALVSPSSEEHCLNE